MDIKKQILQIIDDHSYWDRNQEGDPIEFVEKENWGELADDIIKLFKKLKTTTHEEEEAN